MFTNEIKIPLAQAKQHLALGNTKERDKNLRCYDYLAALYYWFLLCELHKQEQAHNNSPLSQQFANILEFRMLRNV